jgi:hypothetical protein
VTNSIPHIERRSSSAGNSHTHLSMDKCTRMGILGVNSRWNAVLPRYQTGQDFLFEICHAAAFVLRDSTFPRLDAPPR